MHLRLDDVLARRIRKGRNGFADEVEEEFRKPVSIGQGTMVSVRSVRGLRGGGRLDSLLRILLLALFELKRLYESPRVEVTLAGRLEAVEDCLKLIEGR